MTSNQSHPKRQSEVIAPYGGSLVDLMLPKADQEKVKKNVRGKLECSDRNACDIELLVIGGFSPLRGFMLKDDYESVIKNHRTTSGDLFGLPIVMDTDREDLVIGDQVLLTYKGQDIAVLKIEEKWEPDKMLEAKGCYGTTSLEHPAVRMIAMQRKRFYLGGAVHGLELPKRVFPCKTPAELRKELPKDEDVVAFQCRNPIHRAHYELFTRALDADNVSKNAVVLVHPTCGPTQEDDIAGEVRFQTYERLASEVNNPRIKWAYLPYSMHMAGPREALQHMIIRRNYGCTHFIIGRDMAGCKSSLNGDDFYGPYEAQDFAKKYSTELSMDTVPSLNLVFTEEEGYVTAEHAKSCNLHIKKLSGTEFRKMLRNGEDIPEWFAFKSVVEVLRKA
ncbi:sulfate adenylyltransferase [Prochlorococcus marinus]|uniref:sulfate adenylyltransferase n=1 Tax=Prochlorococcus marinus (strain MIT 9211) TaxID=93059 RepID=A9BDJ4_PROM4|nr:sulfate adenylyltransferase [Prochlorococcus marinus]ABX08180.1 ATP-sulfurylase [Prochlorococcus marinus str. MIT 9211]